MARKKRRSAAVDITRLGVTSMVGGITVGHVAGAAPAGARLPTAPIYGGLGLLSVGAIPMAGGALLGEVRKLKRKRR